MHAMRRLFRGGPLTYSNAINGEFDQPNDVCMLPGGELCVADTFNHQLKILSNSGTVTIGFKGQGGSALGDWPEFNCPTGIVADAEHLYVSDSLNNRVVKLRLADYKVVAATGKDVLSGPQGLALESNGSLYIADSNANRIVVLDSSHKFVSTFGSRGFGAGEFLFPHDVALAEGNVYVTDWGNDRMQIFSRETHAHVSSIGGRDSKRFSGPRGLAWLGSSLLVSESNGYVQLCNVQGERLAQLSVQPLVWRVLGAELLLGGMTTDTGRVFVAGGSDNMLHLLAVDRTTGRAAKEGSQPTFNLAAEQPRPCMPPRTTLLYALGDRVVCNTGGPRGWVTGTVQHVNATDHGQAVPYRIRVDPPTGGLVSAKSDSDRDLRREVCFGRHRMAAYFTRACLPVAVGKRPKLRFAVRDKVVCLVEGSLPSEEEAAIWSPGIVDALWQELAPQEVPGIGQVPYGVLLQDGSIVLVHRDQHWLVRDATLQPAGLAAEFSRFVKREVEPGQWELVDHQTCRVRPCPPLGESDEDK